MKKIILFVFFTGILFAKTVEIVTFEYPPLMGKSQISDIGLLPEIVKEAFKANNIETTTKFLPTQRVINGTKMGNSLIMLGLIEYFDKDTQANLVSYPLYNLDFVFFYKKDVFPKGFSYNKPEDLKKYTIGVLLNGITHTYAKANNINAEGVTSLDLIFKKVDMGRNQLGISEYISGINSIEKLFPENEKKWGVYLNKPFFTMNALIIFNKNYPEFEYYDSLFKDGLSKIIKNGKWEQIVNKYKINKESKTKIKRRTYEI